MAVGDEEGESVGGRGARRRCWGSPDEEAPGLRLPEAEAPRGERRADGGQDGRVGGARGRRDGEPVERVGAVGKVQPALLGQRREDVRDGRARAPLRPEVRGGQREEREREAEADEGD